MTKLRTKKFLRLSLITTFALVGGNVHALSTPDTGTCSNNSSQAACLKIDNTNGGAALSGGSVSGAGIGVLGGTGSGQGVYGTAASGYGVYGDTSSGSAAIYGRIFSGGVGNAVVGSTAAATTGVYGLNTNGSGNGVLGQINGTGIAVYGDNPNGSGYAGYFAGAVTITGTPRANQASFTVLSDARLKKNVKPLEGALGQLLRLRGVTYEWKDPFEHGNQTGPQRGFIAQEVEKAIPAWISVDQKGWKGISIPGRDLEALVVESIRTLKLENDDLRSRVARLERGGQTSMSSMVGGGAGLALAIGLLPIGLVAVRRRRKADGN